MHSVLGAHQTAPVSGTCASAVKIARLLTLENFRQIRVVDGVVFSAANLVSPRSSSSALLVKPIRCTASFW